MKKILNRMIAVEMFGTVMLIILTALMIFSFTSCSVQQPTTLLDYDNSGYKVTGYEFPYVEIMLPDSTIDYLYSPYPKVKITKGFIVK